MIKVQYNKFSYKPLIGNNMFQYCLGRIIAEHLQFALDAEPIPGFPNTEERIRGAAYCSPIQTLTGHVVDIEGILADRSPRLIQLEGWFQRHEYYRPHREKIREWLTFNPELLKRGGKRPDVVVHVRRGDYVALGWALPYSYYEEALTRLLPGGGNVLIATDDRKDPFFRNFVRWRPEFSNGSPLEDMCIMANAQCLIMSQSTYSWWPAFLGDLQAVVCPVPSFGVWSPMGEATDANLIERDRFICIECREPYRPTRTEAMHQRIRAVRRRVVLGLNRRWNLSLAEPPA